MTPEDVGRLLKDVEDLKEGIKEISFNYRFPMNHLLGRLKGLLDDYHDALQRGEG